MRLDPVRAVEACYRAGDMGTWLRNVLAQLGPLSRGLGACGYAYDLSGGSFRLAAAEEWGETPPWRDAIEQLHASLPLAVLRAYYGSSSWVRHGGERMRSVGERGRRAVGSAYREIGVSRAIGVHGGGGGCGAVLVIPSAAGVLPGPRTLHLLGRVAAHLGAAVRLRALDADLELPAEAVLAPGGAVVHAEGLARGAGARDALASAARRMEAARWRGSRMEPEEALSTWGELIAGRWTLVERLDADGRRFVLARRNEPGISDPGALTPAERDVVAEVARGLSNKEIAWRLGIATSSVAERLERALAKLALSSRRELILLCARSGGSR